MSQKSLPDPTLLVNSLGEFNEKLGDLVCRAESGLQMMSTAYANKLFPMDEQLAAVRAILKNRMSIEEGVVHMLSLYCFSKLAEIENQSLLKKIFSRRKNQKQIYQTNALWEQIKDLRPLFADSRFEQFSEDLVNYMKNK